MEVLEIALLALAYSALLISLFLQLVCYQRKFESLRTIYLTSSLLLLVISFTLGAFWQNSANSNWLTGFMLVAMSLVALTTPLNILSERKHGFSSWIERLFGVLTAVAILGVLSGTYFGYLELLENIVAIYLGASIVFSMILMSITKPKVRISHRETIDKYLAIAFLIVVPLSLVANYVAAADGLEAKIGFTLPLVIMVLAASKIFDDVKRLSLFSSPKEASDQLMLNYSLTKREQEIARLLLTGMSYQQMADELFVSIPTIKTHVSNIYKKCQVNNKMELTVLISR